MTLLLLFLVLDPALASDCLALPPNSGGIAESASCRFPFIFKGRKYSECSSVEAGERTWCATQTDSKDELVWPHWGWCSDSCGRAGVQAAVKERTGRILKLHDLSLLGVIVVDLMLLPAFVVVTWVAEMGLETVVTGTLVAVVTGVLTGLLEVMVVAKVLVAVVAYLLTAFTALVLILCETCSWNNRPF